MFSFLFPPFLIPSHFLHTYCFPFIWFIFLLSYLWSPTDEISEEILSYFFLKKKKIYKHGHNVMNFHILNGIINLQIEPFTIFSLHTPKCQFMPTEGRTRNEDSLMMNVLDQILTRLRIV